MIQTHEYLVEVRSTGIKTGELSASEDGLDTLEVASPPEFGGPGETWSPEHLYVASIASCLMTTFRAIAEASQLEVLDYEDSATGRLILDEDHLYRIDRVILRPRVVIADETKIDKVYRILEKAERACLIGRSVRSSVQLEAVVLAGERHRSAV